MAKQTHCIVPILVLFLKIIIVNANIRRSDYCSNTPLQTYYTGTINVTVSGKTCQMWNSQSPHQHSNSWWISDTNYCRNKDNPTGAWCLTTDPDVRWERCNVPSCENATYCTLKQKQLCGGNNYCGCKYLCHCGVEASCNPSDGTCFTGNCAPGWMGKSCQFVNIAFNQSTSLRDDKLVDGNRSTCSRRIRNVSLHLNERYPLSALVIVFADGIISSLRISVSVQTNGHPNVINSICSSREVSIADGKLHIFCTHVLRGDQLTIEFNTELSICEIEVYGGRNVALWQSTGQYGTYTDGIYTYPASLAVDGKTSTTLTSRTCTHTSSVVDNEQPWWQITLDSMTTVIRAKLYIRKDYHENRMLGFNISVNNDNNVVYQQHKSLSSGVIDIVDPFPLTIHSLKVTIPTGPDRLISLCEVKIFACLPRRNGTENCKDFCPLKCSENDTCVNQNYECNKCQNGWSEPFCSQDIDECRTLNMCNNGSCINTPGSYYCQCHSGYTGFNCQNDIDECSTQNSCKHGRCVNVPGSYHCQCQSGYTGSNCEADIDECRTLNLCNNGNCINTPGSYHCECHSGYTGLNCETDIDECRTQNLCNHGSCVNVLGSYHCHCQSGYTGSNCQADVTCNTTVFSHPLKLNYSTNAVVLHGKTLMLTCDLGYKLLGNPSTTCQNDGSWDTIPTCKVNETYCTLEQKLSCSGNSDCSCKYLCHCKVGGTCDPHTGTCGSDHCFPGWMGESCQFDVDECRAQNLCNHGNCINLPGSYHCQCQSGYTGSNCEAVTSRETNKDLKYASCYVVEIGKSKFNLTQSTVPPGTNFLVTCKDIHSSNNDVVTMYLKNLTLDIGPTFTESLQNDKQDKSSVRIYKGTLIAMGVIITLLIAVCTTLCILLIRHRSTGKEKGGQKDTTYTDLQLSHNGNSEESNYTQLELHH